MPINPSFDGASKVLRPDVLSLDYLVSYTLGPVAQGDVSLGFLNRAWKVRADNTLGKVFVSRANDANNAWEAETELFSYAGTIVEIDAAFEQAGRIVVCAEIAGSIWIYFYDSAAVPAGFVFTNFGAGRNPRAILDNPEQSSDSDVVVFYVSVADDTLVYRQQRDRYAIKYLTPTTSVSTKYLEDVVRATDWRLHCIFSSRNTVTGQFTLETLESLLYPVSVKDDKMTAALVLVNGVLVTGLFIVSTFGAPEGQESGWVDPDNMSASLVLVSGALVDPLILHTLYDKDEMTAGLSLISGQLFNTLIEHTLYDKDEMKAALVLQSGSMSVIVIEHTLYDKDEMKADLTLQSGSLVPA